MPVQCSSFAFCLPGPETFFTVHVPQSESFRSRIFGMRNIGVKAPLRFALTSQ